MQSAAITTEKQLSQAKQLIQRLYCPGCCSRIGAILVNEAEGAFDARMQWPVRALTDEKGPLAVAALSVCGAERERTCTQTERKNPCDDRLDHSPCFNLLNSFDHVGHVVQIADEIVLSDQDIAVKGSNDRSQSREPNAHAFVMLVQATSSR